MRRAAPWREVRLWFLLSSLISVVMLVGVAIAGSLLPAAPYEGQFSRLLNGNSDAPIDEIIYVFGRNLLVLALHFFCCQVGAIIGREHVPLEGKWARYSRFHQELPKWVADLSLAYALTVTLASIAIQTTGLGFILADISAYAQLAPWKLMILIIPHAVPELIGIFLPLALFLIQARRRQLRPLGDWAWQSFALGLPLIAIAAVIEVCLTPDLIAHFADPITFTSGGYGDALKQILS